MHKIPLKQKTGERAVMSGDISVKADPDELNMLNDDVEIESMKGSGMEHGAELPEEHAKSLYQKSALNLDADVQDKVIKILLPQLKGVRKLYETKQKLVSSVGKGGAGLSEKHADALLQVYLDEKHGQMLADNPERAKKMDQPKKIDVQEHAMPEAPPNLPIAESVQVKDIAEDAAEISEDIPKVEPASMEVVTKPDVPEVEPEMKEEVSVAEDMPKEGLPAVSEPVEQKTPVDTVRQAEYAAPLIGPLEELQTMGLTDFRQLAGSPMAQAQKVQAKIDTIGESSVAEKLAAIKAWKESKVMNAYLIAGKNSVMSGDTINDVINKQLQVDPESITLDEFNAIMELNENLREID